MPVRPLQIGLKGSGSATVDATGICTVTIKPQGSTTWSVTQLSIEMPNAPSGTVLTLRTNGHLIDSPFSARRATAGGDPPIPLRPGDDITAEWTGATPGEQGLVFYIYDEVGYR